MAEGLQAGRLEVPVVADLSGFAEKLRTKVEEAAAGLAVSVKVKVNDKGLRRRLEKAVEKASRGVTATVRVKVDQDRFRTELDRVRAELDGIASRVADTGIALPVQPDGDRSPGGGFLGRLRSLISGAQGEADRNPVNVPVQMRLPRGRRTLRMLGMGALVSLIQPAVAALGQYALGLTALVSAAAPAVGVLGAIPGLIAAAGSAAIGTKVAFSGFGDALKESMKAQQMLARDGKVTKAQQQKLNDALDKLSQSARKSVAAVSSLSGAWDKVKMSVSERFFSKVADDIKPLAKAVFPLLKDALGDSAAQMGKLAERGARFMRTGPFRKDFKTVAGTNKRVLGNLTDSMANLAAASGHFLVASGPFVERVGRATERFTRWVRASAKAGRETGSLAKFLDHAGDKAAQLGRSTGSLIRGIGGVGRAAMDTGNALLNGFEGTMKRFERWANSDAGQKVMKQFFSDSAPMFHELNMLVGDFMRGLGRAMKDGGVTDLVRQIRTELMPAIGAFLNAIGQSIGPAVVSLLSNVATAIASISDAGSGLGVLLVAFSGLLNVFNGIMSTVPGANTVLATLLGTMLAFKVVSGITSMLGRFGASMAAAGASAMTLGGTMRGTLGPGVMGPQITMWQRMGAAYRGASAEGGRLSGAMRGLGAANRVASSAMGGMVSALGGPLGIAIAGATIGLGLLASKHEEAARATQAHQERVSSLAAALADSNGVIDANVRAHAVQLLQDAKLADGKGRLVDVLRDAGVNLTTLTDAYLEQGGTIDGLQKKLLDLAEASKVYKDVAGGKATILEYDEQGEKYKAAADALGAVNGELKESRRDAKEAAAAMDGVGETGTDAYSRLQAAVDGFNNKTLSADQRVQSLKRALDALNGNTQSFHDATAQLNAVMLQIDDTMAGTIEKSEGWGKALVNSDGLVNTSTRNGQALNTQLNELRDSMLGVATSAKEAAEQGTMPMSEAMKKSEAAMEQARAKAIAFARDLGIPKKEAEALADQMGFVPDTITTLVTTSNLPETTAEVMALRGELDSLEAGKSIVVDAPTTEAREQIQALGFNVTRLPGSKKVMITAPSGEARANITALAQDLASVPEGKEVSIQAVIKQAVGNLQKVQEQVTKTRGKPITMTAITATAEKALTDLGFKVTHMKDGKVKVTVPTGTPISQVNAIQATIDRLRGKTVTVTTNYVVTGNTARQPGSAGTQLAHANGGIVEYFANGGIRRENHIAQIAPAGSYRIWGERETGGEAYVPLANSKRARSKAVVEEVVRRFGGAVAWFANGGIADQKTAALYRAASSAGAARRMTAGGAGAPALVGGDLNINVGAVASVGNALDDAMFELRRIKLGGHHG